MPLLVYKSSAGSGKTTTLVNEYLKITLKNPDVFKHVLAITFTNNAANEMKGRILQALGKIIDGSAWEDNELKDLFNALNLEKWQLVKNATRLQQLIIHRYDEFAVSTIDSFVHRIVRTFATDVKLPQNFEVVIESDDIVPDIVDELFNKVGADSALTEIMVQFVMSQTDDEKNHDIGSLVSGFVNNQLSEEGFSFVNKIADLEASDFVRLIKKMKHKLDTLKSGIKKNASEAQEIIHQNGLEESDFTRKSSGIYGYFNKNSILKDLKNLEPNSYVRAAIYDDVWTTKAASPAIKSSIDQIKDELIIKFGNIVSESKNLFLLNAIYGKIYALALTNNIRNIFDDYTDRTQRVHISEFNKRISNEIAKQPVPFIYERLGMKYRYFLIDEFQDTSVLQWQNLLPLVEESLANNNFNLLVGDAKQSIYRFRGGEVELFSSLPKLHENDGSQKAIATENLLTRSYKEVPLNFNWRSYSEIINFNNEFFEIIKQDFSERLLKVYKDHQQDINQNAKKEGGFVAIDLIEAEKPEEYAALRLTRIHENINSLIEAGYKQNEMCILTKTNAAAVEIASYLLQNDFSVITSESLLLTNSTKVRLVIAFLRLLDQSNATSLLAEFVQSLIAEKGQGDFNEIMEELIPLKDEGLSKIMSALGLNVNVSQLISLPVFEIAEAFIQQLNLFENPDTYLRFFLDFVLVTQENGRGGVNDFLELWDKKKEKLYITMPDGGEAIKVMTVHKAKGLKFESVILDVADRGTKKGKREYWTDIEVEGLEELKVGLLPITKELEKIDREEVLSDEEDKTRLDFINMVYVAFTRPVSALFLIGHIEGNKKEKFSELLLKYLDKKEYSKGENPHTFSIGSLKEPKRKESDDANEVIVLKDIISTSWEDQIRVAPSDEVYWEAIDSKPARVYGNLIHSMLSEIVVADDVDKVVNESLMMAVIDKQEAEEIRKVLNKTVTHPQLKQYFSRKVRVKNETEILDPFGGKNTFQRPDRVVLDGDVLVVIDYKTGEKEKKHIAQMQLYGSTFVKLGFKNVELKLAYLTGEIDVVNVSMPTNSQPKLF